MQVSVHAPKKVWRKQPLLVTCFMIQEYWNCNRFEPVGGDGKPATVRVDGKYTLAMLPTDLVLKSTPELAEIASEFIGPNELCTIVTCATCWRASLI